MEDQAYRHYTMAEREAYSCRVCSECQGYSHHWIDQCGETTSAIYTHTCKHCNMTGCECEDCGGEGCQHCEGEGVKELTWWCEDCENVICTCDDEDDDA